MQNNDLGYTKKLCILPFDHRSYFENLLGYHEPLTKEQSNELSEYKKIVYTGYEKSLSRGVVRDESAILVDDVFGMDILLDAKKKGYIVLQSTEVSGADHFEFEHGVEWQSWIEKVQPDFAKVLIRYNPDANQELNQKTLANLKKLSEYSHLKGYKLIIESLVPATEAQLASVAGDKSKYDHELRPDLTVRMIEEIQNAGVEADVWKIEGMYTREDYEKAVAAATREGRLNVGTISLGRNETDEVVETWLRVGSEVKGVIGFAVGRTIFLDALLKYRGGEYTKEQAAEKISERFVHFYKVFNR